MTIDPPSVLFGALFADVQERGLFPDSKTFADAVPRRAPVDILRDWTAAEPLDDAALGRFVADNFDLPVDVSPATPDRAPLAEHIVALWPSLTRDAVAPPAHGSLLPLPRRHVVPGGRFRELYYWDSYFTMLGLVRSGRQDLVEDMIVNFGSLLDDHGHIPNGTRTYYLSRSHPPVFYLMAGLSQDGSEAARRQRLGWMRREHDFWMDGADTLPEGGEHRRVVRLAGGALLNRYWDDRPAPRDESWREDVELARRVPDRDAAQLWRDIRAAAESGWDFSSRWLGDGRSLETIRTTRLLPIDLNALLYGLERSIAVEAASLGDASTAARYDAAALARRDAINTWLWDGDSASYRDYDIDSLRVGGSATAAQGFALFTGVVPQARAAGVADSLHGLVRPGGLLATDRDTDQQWDAPNGWAPLQWVAIQGLHTYRQTALAEEIAKNWSTMVRHHFEASGLLLEKYDVISRTAGGGGEYGTEIGFGWTNGVTLALLS